MSMRGTRRAAMAACAAVALALVPSAAFADSKPKAPSADTAEIAYDPNLSMDALITDAMESQDLTGTSSVTCTYESVQSGVNPVPSSPSFQLMYVVPSNVTPEKSLDVPQSCNDGSVRYSAIARASRNMATWLYKQNAALNFRTSTITYTHNYNSNQYATRGVRRFVSPSSLATWESYAMKIGADGTSPRLEKMRTELVNNHFNVASTKYAAVLATHTQRSCSTSTNCYYYVGAADIGGPYGLTTRTYNAPTGDVKLRFGCASDGDSFFAHESTHQVGADHVNDNANDLMAASKSNANFNTSPALIWDYGRNSYHTSVRANAYVVPSNLSGSYFTC